MGGGVPHEPLSKKLIFFKGKYGPLRSRGDHCGYHYKKTCFVCVFLNCGRVIVKRFKELNRPECRDLFTSFFLELISLSYWLERERNEAQIEKSFNIKQLIKLDTADFIKKKVLSVYTNSMTNIYLSLSAQVRLISYKRYLECTLIQYRLSIPPWGHR